MAMMYPSEEWWLTFSILSKFFNIGFRNSFRILEDDLFHIILNSFVNIPISITSLFPFAIVNLLTIFSIEWDDTALPHCFPTP